MLLLELRAAGVDHTWNEIRRQRQLPFAILASNGSFPRPRSCTTSPQLLRNLLARRNSHSSAKWTITNQRSEPNVYPESLQDTLEAHRNPDRAARIRRQVYPEVNEHKPRLPASGLYQRATAGLRQSEQDAEEGTLQETVHGLGPGREYRPYVSSSVLIDYQGVSQPPNNEWNLSKYPAPGREKKPWLAHLDQASKATEYVYDYLTAEILAFEKYMESTAAEKAAVGEALSDLRKTIETLDPALKVSVVGSRSTGLAMPLSDIDINIEPPNPLLSGTDGGPPWPLGYVAARKQAMDLLGKIKRNLKKRGGPKPVFYKPKLIQARVPIVNAVHIATNLDIQIQCSLDGNVSMDFAKAYLKEYPTLRPLFLVLRQVLKMRSLGDPRTHGIGSYPLLMMIVATLKFSSSRFDRTDVGRQLLYFLDFYSKFDFRTTGIAVDPPELFPKFRRNAQVNHGFCKAKVQREAADEMAITQANDADMDASNDDDETATTEADEAYVDSSHGRKIIRVIHPRRPYLMCLQDPARSSNDLGRHATAIKHVKATFATLAIKLRIAMELFEARGGCNSTFSLLEPCLAGNYERFEQKREKLKHIGGKLTVTPVVAQYF